MVFHTCIHPHITANHLLHTAATNSTQALVLGILSPILILNTKQFNSSKALATDTKLLIIIVDKVLNLTFFHIKTKATKMECKSHLICLIFAMAVLQLAMAPCRFL